ncbi:MAG: hypothetical protein Wins2KO_16020 [Winogradskyella sp.]
MKNEDLNNISETGFKTPDNYFESFEDKLFERLADQDNNIGVNDTGFKVPDNYFDTLEDTILDKLDQEETPVVQLRPRTKFYYIAGIAASIVLILALFINRNTVDELSVEMVESYFENKDLDSYELAELLTETEILEEDFEIIETNLDEENIETYLLDNADLEYILE